MSDEKLLNNELDFIKKCCEAYKQLNSNNNSAKKPVISNPTESRDLYSLDLMDSVKNGNFLEVLSGKSNYSDITKARAIHSDINDTTAFNLLVKSINKEQIDALKKIGALSLRFFKKNNKLINAIAEGINGGAEIDVLFKAIIEDHHDFKLYNLKNGMDYKHIKGELKENIRNLGHIHEIMDIFYTACRLSINNETNKDGVMVDTLIALLNLKSEIFNKLLTDNNKDLNEYIYATKNFNYDIEYLKLENNFNSSETLGTNFSSIISELALIDKNDVISKLLCDKNAGAFIIAEHAAGLNSLEGYIWNRKDLEKIFINLMNSVSCINQEQFKDLHDSLNKIPKIKKMANGGADLAGLFLLFPNQGSVNTLKSLIFSNGANFVIHSNGGMPEYNKIYRIKNALLASSAEELSNFLLNLPKSWENWRSEEGNNIFHITISILDQKSGSLNYLKSIFIDGHPLLEVKNNKGQIPIDILRDDKLVSSISKILIKKSIKETDTKPDNKINKKPKRAF